MTTVTRRLNALWLRQPDPSIACPAQPKQSAAKMFVKVTEPLRIGRRALPPGTYLWRLSDAGVDPSRVQILNEDQTELIATINSTLDD